MKPANMLLDPSTVVDRPHHVYLSDFGLSKSVLAGSGLTATGQLLGTLDYVSPEQIEGRPLDGRSDEYSLACSVFVMLCGEPPFRREQGVSVMYAHLSEPLPSVRARRPELPAEIDEVLAKAMAKAPGARYATCGDFAAALRQALGIGISVPETQPAGDRTTEVLADVESGGAAASWPESGWRRPWWRSPAPVAALCMLAVLLAGGGFLAARASGDGGSGRPPGTSATVLALPRCTTATARAANLTGVDRATTALRGGPFGVAVTANGRYSFVTTGNAVAVLRPGSGLAPTLVRTIRVRGLAKGLAITPDGRYLVVADGSGAVVINVARPKTAPPGRLWAP